MEHLLLTPPPVPGACWTPYLPQDELLQPLPRPPVLLQLGRVLPLGLIPW